MHVVAARQPLDEPEQARRDAVAAGRDRSRRRQRVRCACAVKHLTRGNGETDRLAAASSSRWLRWCGAPGVGAAQHARHLLHRRRRRPVDAGGDAGRRDAADRQRLSRATARSRRVPGDPHKARDANRILAAARAAGVKRIDYLLITHFHADHDGAVPELAQLIPIRHVRRSRAAGRRRPKSSVPGTQAAFERYARVRANGKHLVPKPGDRIPLRGVETIVVSAARRDAAEAARRRRRRRIRPAARRRRRRRSRPRIRARPASACASAASRFSTSAISPARRCFALACPTNLIGPTDLYLVAHHAGPDAGGSATFAGVRAAGRDSQQRRRRRADRPKCSRRCTRRAVSRTRGSCTARCRPGRASSPTIASRTSTSRRRTGSR